MLFDHETEVFDKQPIGENSIGSLAKIIITTNRYFTLSTGAMIVLFNEPAIPPAIKILRILCFSYYECFIGQNTQRTQ